MVAVPASLWGVGEGAIIGDIRGVVNKVLPDVTFTRKSATVWVFSSTG